jgi:hypothetical protein
VAGKGRSRIEDPRPIGFNDLQPIERNISNKPKKRNRKQFLKRFENYMELYKNELISSDELMEKLQGWFGYARWANTYKMREKIKEEVMNLKKSNLALISISRQLEKNRREISKSLSSWKGRLNLSQQKVKVTERIFKEESRRYKYGKITLEKLIETRKDFSEYRFKYFSDRIAYNKILIDWLNFKDVLIDDLKKR